VCFLSLFLHHVPADVVTGSNACTEQTCTGASGPCTGFKAAKGWDAATGLGSFNYAEFVKGMALVL